MDSDVQFEISQRPDFGLISVQLEQGQKIFAEPSAMVAMDPSITLKAGLKGGIKKTIGRALGGESMVINTFTADRDSGEVIFAPGAPGDVMHYHLDMNTLMVQRGAFVAHTDGVELTGKWQGAKGFFSGKGLVLLQASGTGDLFFNSYGAILEIDVRDEYIVDTGYVVAFENTLHYQVDVLPGLKTSGKLKSFLFGGEGLVAKFSGQGKIWVQTRAVNSFLTWIYPFRPAPKHNN